MIHTILLMSLLSHFYLIIRKKSKYYGRVVIIYFESVDILDIYIHNINLKRGKSYIKSPEWISSKKATINSKNTKDNIYFQYAITVALNHQKLITTQKEYQILELLLANIIGKT